MERLVFSKIKELELRVRLSNHFNIPIEEIDSEIIDFSINYINSEGDSADAINTYEAGDNWSPNLEIFEYNIDVSTGVWMSLALVLDIYYTKGISSTALSSLGKSNQVIFKIERGNGELCLAKQLKRSNFQTFDIITIEEILCSMQCPNNFDSCYGTVVEVCTFKGSNVPDLITRLEKKKVISKISSDRWKMNI